MPLFGAAAGRYRDRAGAVDDRTRCPWFSAMRAACNGGGHAACAPNRAQHSAVAICRRARPQWLVQATLLSAIAGVTGSRSNSQSTLAQQHRVLTCLARCVRLGRSLSPKRISSVAICLSVTILPATMTSRQQGESRQGRRRRVDAWLEQMELGGMANRDPATLSGGQKARVAVGPPLATEPRAVLLDEPFFGRRSEAYAEATGASFFVIFRPKQAFVGYTRLG